MAKKKRCLGCHGPSKTWRKRRRMKKHSIGHWLAMELVPNDITGHMYGECSICHKVRIVDNYCPNCGARMKDEVEE